MYVECATQADLDAVPAGKIAVVRSGFFVAWGSSRVVAWGSSRVVARESSSVEAWESSSVEARESSSVEARGSSSVVAWESSSVVAWESSSVVAWESSRVEAWGWSRVVAWGSSRVVAWGSSRVEAWGSSRVEARGSSRVVARDSSSVEARGSSRVEARESSRVEAAPLVAVHRFSREAVTKGGIIIDCTRIHDDIGEWCAYYGASVKRGRVTVFKAVDDELLSGHGHEYPVGKTVKCNDFKPTAKCGNGLHFCADPRSAQARYFPEATRFLECTISAKDAVIVGDKLKAPACRVVREVDSGGRPV